MKTYTKKEILDWLGKHTLGMPRPDNEMKKEESNLIGRIEGRYEILDLAKKEL